MMRRHIESEILESLSDTAVVFVDGARQTGKSTLVKRLAATAHRADYVTLDDPTVRAAAAADPTGWLAAHPANLAIDEVQRVPALYLALKAAVDRDRRPGRFLLTGSADALLLPQLADALVGRMARITLWPFSLGEVHQFAGANQACLTLRGDFVAQLFASVPDFRGGVAMDRSAAIDAVLAGGYPEANARPAGRRRQAWFANYVTTILQRDVRDLSQLADDTHLLRLLTLVAARTAQLHNGSEVARSLAMPHSTLDRHLALLHAVFLVQSLPAWSANLGKRLVKAPKLLLADTGVAGHVLGLDRDRFAAAPHSLGPLLENFVAMELRKQLGWSSVNAQLFHYRDHSNTEVDLLLQSRQGHIAGVEVKAAGQVAAQDFAGLRMLRAALGDAFRCGVVVYLGPDVVPFGDRLWAVPFGALLARDSGTSLGSAAQSR